MSDPGRRQGEESPTISPAAVPLLLLGLIIGFLAGYFLLWWGLFVVLAVLVGAAAMVFRGGSRDAGTGVILGVLAGYGVVILLAAFRGVL
ncbi:hypothetical protein [Brachybacterium fresconis]|uniref:Membrane protein (Fun14 family) n=1 Tax=Brachybacterium fresconis TaxID=173363 RepID=A0ABS4YEI8_9MICO|nr:hypothetical protein [Brachybacterium fresconis]MBP2407149.1 putative membrane protein (Fun14 family) [Brachybacterium fresconis]